MLSLERVVAESDYPSNLGVRQIRVRELVDGPGNTPDEFVKAVAILSTLVQEAPPVLVQCHAGQSRSVAVVAGYLMKHEGMSEDSALVSIAEKREGVAVQPALIDLLSYL